MGELPGYDSGVGDWSTSGRASGPRGGHVSAEERRRIVRRLNQLRASGDFGHDRVVRAAEAVGVTARTVYRWLRDGEGYVRAPSPRRYVLSEADRQAYEDFAGNVAQVYRTRCAVLAGKTTVSGVPIAEHLLEGWRDAEPVGRGTLYEAFTREMNAAERAFWKYGEKARRDRRIYGDRVIDHRNSIWQADHSQLKIVVQPPRGKPLCPWLTTFVDLYSRVIMGWAISQRPDTGVVLTALRMALLCDPAQGGHGGVPAVIECDNGKEIVADPIARPTATLDIEVRRVESYEGRRKGGIERWHDTIATMLLSQLPGYTRGPRDKRGRLYGPVRDDASWRAALPEVPDGQEPAALPITTFTRVFARWVHWFNTEHQHQGLGGSTPLQVWNDDPTNLAVVDPDQLRDLLKVKKDAKITSSGIAFRNLHYWAPEFQGRVGDTIEIRYAPHDDRFIEVYDQGRHLAQASPTDAATPAEAEQHRQAWDEHTRRLTARRRKASARARRRMNALTHQDVWPSDPVTEHSVPARSDSGEPAVETRLVPRTAPLPPMTGLRGSTSLLGLVEPAVLDLDAACPPEPSDAPREQ